MGCHTWFSRPITCEEFQLMKDYAETEIYELIGGTEKNIQEGFYDEALYNILMKSLKENIPCVYGKYYWWQFGWGQGNPLLLNGTAFIHGIKGYNNLFVDVDKYHDIFRVKNYPSKVITNRRGLKKWMKKRYFELTEEQLEKISKFFEEYHGGVITFG